MVRATVMLPRPDSVGLPPCAVAEAAVTRTLPSVNVRLPVIVLAPPERVSVPAPDFERPAEPLMTPESVWLPLPVRAIGPVPPLARLPA